MISKISLWIQKIQKNNWGFPWHFFFANILFHLFFPVFMFTPANWDRGIIWALIASFISVNIIGYLNEILDRDKDPTEFWQDVGANNVGIVIGIIQWLYIMQLFYIVKSY